MNAQKSPSVFPTLSNRLWLSAAVGVLLLLPVAAQPAQRSAPPTGPANTIRCGKITDVELQPVPEIASSGGVLSGTLYTVSEQVKMATPGTGTKPTDDPYDCYPQWVRAFRRDAPSSWNPPSSQLLNPMPGPTLRARIGEMVELTFLNSIDSNKFPNADKGCDQTSVYPGKDTATGTADTYPDCFAGSVFTNVHYHGTHTNPNSTGDNVFLQIRPSPRITGTNAPVVTADSVKGWFTTFFGDCEQQLKLNPGPKIWPTTWDDLPPDYVKWQQELLQQYAPAWYTSNENLRKKGNWPQYYIGAYPYCFKLPDYAVSTAAASTVPASAPTTAPAVRTPHTHGRGSAEVDESQAPARPLLMGQSPGTHWYHAHKHGSTTINVLNGMTGVFVIEGPYDDAIRKFYSDAGSKLKEQVMVVQQLGSLPGLSVGAGLGPGPDFSINGQLYPRITMAGNSVQMWRVANTAARAGIYFIAPTALQWKQLSQDGVQFNSANYQENSSDPFLLMSGNRADLLVKAPAYNSAPGANNSYDVLVYNTVDPSDRPPQKPAVAQIKLLKVVVTQNGSDMQFMADAPTFPPFLSDITDAEITGTKILKFASTPVPAGPPPPGAQHTIDGKKFDGELGAVVELNRAEEWKIVNETYPPGNQISHPFHIHINPFQISEVFDPNAVMSTTLGRGTVTTIKGSSIVTGVGFKTDFQPGDFILINGEKPATVVSIETDTSLTFNIAAAGVTARYTVAVPMYALSRNPLRPGQCVLNAADPETWKPCGPTVPAGNRIWWDVFPIPSGNVFTIVITPAVPATATTPAIPAVTKQFKIPGYFKMRSRFVDFAGYYVLHCHILAHEDRGMMTVVEVTPLQTPYSHH